jgi:hypothetical protein
MEWLCWMDHEQALFTIRFQFGAMFAHIAKEHQDHAGLLWRGRERGLVHDAGVLDAAARALP